MSTPFDPEREEFISSSSPPMEDKSYVGSFMSALLWLAVFVGIGLGIASFAIVMSNLNTIEHGKTKTCSSTKVFDYSLTGREVDTAATDWLTQSRDYFSSFHNGHLSNIYDGSVKRASGFCPGGIDYVRTTVGGVGVSVTPTVSNELNMMFFADHGDKDGFNVIIYAINLTTCAPVWTKLMSDFTSELALGGNDAAAGFTNPLANVFSTIQVTNNRFSYTTGGILVFGDAGSGMYYNKTMCDVSQRCGARIYVVGALTGTLYIRSIVKEAVSTIVNYTRWSDMITMAPQIYREIVYVATTSNETYTVIDNGILDFYGVYMAMDIFDGVTIFATPVNSAAQITAGNIGVGIASTPPIDLDSSLILFSTTNALNYSQATYLCLQAAQAAFPCQASGMYNNILYAVDIPTAITEGTVARHQWHWSPYGADAWNGACLTGIAAPCPGPSDFASPNFGYQATTTIIENECGQRFIVSVGQSGTLYSNIVLTGQLVWYVYLGPSSNKTATYGLSFDGKSIWVTVGNLDKKSYLTLDGTKRCDSMWIKVNAWTGVIEDIIPVPCSRASQDCPAIVADPYLTGDFFSESVLMFVNRGTEKFAAAVACPVTSNADIRKGSFGATAVAPIITTNNLMFAGSFTGHLHAYTLAGEYVASLSQCETGIIYGGASISKLLDGKVLLAYGCGYGAYGYPITVGGDQVKTLLLS